MKKVTFDAWMREKLNNLEGDVELCDESGRTVGYFIPAERHRKLLYAWLNSLVTDEELEKARREGGGRPLSEILADLEKQ